MHLRHSILTSELVLLFVVGCQNLPAPPDNSPENDKELQTQDDIVATSHETLIEVAPITNEGEAPLADNPPESIAGSTEEANNTCPDIRAFNSLCDKQRLILSQIKDDPDPDTLFAVESQNIGRHYLVSDEKHPDLFKNSIENKGGTYMGVGFEQGYLYIGWQRPSLAFLIDYDPWIILNHRILIEILKQCPDAKCLYNNFHSRDMIDKFLCAQAITDARSASKISDHRILRLRHAATKALNKLRNSELPNMMNTPDIYNNIRSLALGGRLRIVQANLLDTHGIQAIASVMNELNAQLDTLYLSNAEQYWNYSDEFKANMLSLPFAEDGIIMRTWATYPLNGDYRYSTQRASTFKSWMSSHKTKSVKQMTKHVRSRDIAQFSLIVDDLTPNTPLPPSFFDPCRTYRVPFAVFFL